MTDEYGDDIKTYQTFFQVTHSCNTPWADNWKVDIVKEDEKDVAEHDGLSEFGKKVRT